MDWDVILGNAARSALGPTAAAYALLAVGLNMHFGYTGLFNFGVVGFMLVGAYGLGITVVIAGWSMWVGVVVGLASAVVLALLLGLPTVRLRADYFAIVTIAVAEILRRVVRATDVAPWTGGPFGLQSVAPDFYDLNPFPTGRFGVGVLEYSSTQMWALVVTWGLAIVATLAVWLLMRSPWGRVIRSIREDEEVARSLGKNVFAYKLQSLMVGGFIAGLGGVMFAIAGQTVNADAFLPNVTFFVWTVVILGGAATVFGPIVGAMLFWFLNAGITSFLREGAAEDTLPGILGDSTSAGAVTLILVGIGLILLLVFRPQGIFGSRREMELE
jgi:branched-chain amino acid transport system permease protein